MSLTKEEFHRLDFAVREIEDILGDVSMLSCVSILAGLKQDPSIANIIMDNLENLEREIDSDDDS